MLDFHPLGELLLSAYACKQTMPSSKRTNQIFDGVKKAGPKQQHLTDNKKDTTKRRCWIFTLWVNFCSRLMLASRQRLQAKERTRFLLKAKSAPNPCISQITKKTSIKDVFFVMGDAGFGPAKSLTTDLQSAPFGRSGIHPYVRFLPDKY